MGTEFKLADVRELDYLHSDEPYPRGEVLIRGPGVFQGYFKQDEMTELILD